MKNIPPVSWKSPHARALPPLGSRLIWMGILNVTPDSFSDGGRYLAPDDAVAQARRLIEDGADILDMGAESTRPGFEPISSERECQRLLPALKAVRERFPDIPISIDTYKAETARAAIEAGADMINDIWGLKADIKNGISPMAAQVARLNCPVVVMHNRAQPCEKTGEALWTAVFDDLRESLDLAQNAGIPRSQILLDIGIGFGKGYAQQLECLRHCQRLRELGLPLLLGTSRKSALSKTVGGIQNRDAATAASIVWALARGGCDVVRVHDVGFCRKFAQLGEALAYR